MGYWEEREAKEKKTKSRWSEEPEEQEEQEEEKIEYPENGDNINFEALDQYEQESNAHAKDVLNAIDDLAAQVKAQKVHMGDITSATYWFAVCFNTQDQKEEFLDKMGFNPTDTFLGGKEFAKKCGIKLEAPSRLYNTRKIFVKYQNRARPLKKVEE